MEEWVWEWIAWFESGSLLEEGFNDELEDIPRGR